jgi:hypothetical protein
MSLTVTIKDTTGVGKVINTIDLTFGQNAITVKDIIEARVVQEATAYNQKMPEYFNGLVQPVHAERTLNGYKMRERKKIDVEKQVYVALDSFQKNGFFILIDNKQAETLEQEITIAPSTNIRFIKLTPLVGG